MPGTGGLAMPPPEVGPFAFDGAIIGADLSFVTAFFNFRPF